MSSIIPFSITQGFIKRCLYGHKLSKLKAFPGKSRHRLDTRELGHQRNPLGPLPLWLTWNTVYHSSSVAECIEKKEAFHISYFELWGSILKAEQGCVSFPPPILQLSVERSLMRNNCSLSLTLCRFIQDSDLVWKRIDLQHISPVSSVRVILTRIRTVYPIQEWTCDELPDNTQKDQYMCTLPPAKLTCYQEECSNQPL